MRITAGHGGAAVINRLRTKSLLMQERFKENLAIAGLFVEAEAVERCPVDTGHLKGSADTDMDTTTVRGQSQPIVHIYFTAAYAVFVHENLTAHHEVGMAKYLSKAVSENVRQIRAILKQGLVK